MKEKFTPGEYKVADGKNSHFVYCLNDSGYNRFCFSISQGETIKIGKNGNRFAVRTPVDELCATAHLLAAAPKMYKTLQELSPVMDDKNLHGLARLIDAILAEARGES